MFLAAQLIIVKIWKWLDREQMYKENVADIHNGDHSAIKKDKFNSFV